MTNTPSIDAQSRYRKSLTIYSRQLAAVQSRVNLISNLRLVVVIAAIIAGTVSYRMHFQWQMAASMLAGIIGFILLAARHSRLFRKLDELKALAAINQQGIDRCEDRWAEFKERGDEFVDHDHPYSSDLDIFGRNSLYQYCCCAHTFYGKNRLAELLRGRCGDIMDITDRQEAINHLSNRFTWRQMLECFGYAPAVGNDPAQLIAWAEGGGSLRSWKSSV